ncbi:MAG TPA: DUF2034 domain-containing protein [Thermoanaerobaculales bacterium]|nr:DUF2034 domain-containing protein [Thermoanaerobaculales bacterium]
MSEKIPKMIVELIPYPSQLRRGIFESTKSYKKRLTEVREAIEVAIMKWETIAKYRTASARFDEISETLGEKLYSIPGQLRKPAPRWADLVDPWDDSRCYTGLPHYLSGLEIEIKLEEEVCKDMSAQREAEYWALLGGAEFEQKVCDILRRSGRFTSVERTGKPGDGGVDLLATSEDGEITIIQCKAHKTRISPGPVRDLYGTLSAHPHARKAILVTPAGGTAGAVKFARSVGIEIWSAELLSGLEPTPIESKVVSGRLVSLRNELQEQQALFDALTEERDQLYQLFTRVKQHKVVARWLEGFDRSENEREAYYSFIRGEGERILREQLSDIMKRLDSLEDSGAGV